MNNPVRNNTVSASAAERLENIAQTYAQAPWRKQVQMIGLFSLLLVIMALIAGIYLSVSARTAAAGREIQHMQNQISELNQEIENLQARLAFLNSSAEMAKRAREKGFKPLNEDRVVYLPVNGYIDRQPVVLAPYTHRPLPVAPALPPQFTESLFEWLARQIDEFHSTQPAKASGALFSSPALSFYRP
jgi:cell division protein FtsL